MPDTDAIDYLRLFGLDRFDASGNPGSDGRVDFYNDVVFDLTHGLLRYPADFPAPFAASREVYARNAWIAADDLAWNGTYLADNLTPEIYDGSTPISLYSAYAAFRFVVTLGTP